MPPQTETGMLFWRHAQDTPFHSFLHHLYARRSVSSCSAISAWGLTRIMMQTGKFRKEWEGQKKSHFPDQLCAGLLRSVWDFILLHNLKLCGGGKVSERQDHPAPACSCSAFTFTKMKPTLGTLLKGWMLPSEVPKPLTSPQSIRYVFPDLGARAKPSP